MNLSLNQTLDILAQGLSSFNPKRFYWSYARSCSLCERRTSFAWDLSLENFVDSYLCFRLTLLHSVSYLFSSYLSPSSSCTVFDSNSSNVDEIFLINPSANMFVFGDFNVHHKDWLTYSGGMIDLVNSVIIFQMILLRWLTFLFRSLTVTLTILFFWIYFFLLTQVFVLQWLFLFQWEIRMLLSQFPFTFR